MRQAPLIGSLLIFGLTAMSLRGADAPAGGDEASTPVVLTAATDHKYYRELADNEIYVQARIQVATGNAEPGAGPSTANIAFVLDRSGSMAGPPFQAVREAVMSAVSLLRDQDRVSVVVFGSEVETLVESQPRGQVSDLDTQLARIEPSGGSALYDALNQGAALLRRHAGPTTIDHLVLLTDGPATKGPREAEDFARLAAVFAREGITLSSIGLGDEFEEDLLAAMARIGSGRFSYVSDPSTLPAVFQDEVAPMRTMIGRDATLSITFRGVCSQVKSHGWEPADVERKTVTYRFPRLYAGQDVTVLSSGTVDSFLTRMPLSDLAVARLTWTDPETRATRELEQSVSVYFATDSRSVVDSANAEVFRTAANTTISEGMQTAIDFIDKGDFKRAERALRRTRGEVVSLNYDLEDAQIAAMIAQLDTYLAEVRERGLNQLDRKILRSGLFNQFEIPTAEDSDE